MRDLSDLQNELREILRREEYRYFSLLRQMVAINSFTENHAGVEALAHLTAASFAELGFLSESVPSEDPKYGPHLVMTHAARTGGVDAPKIGFVSHLDTVFPPEEEKLHDFAWREEGDRIYGPGTVDIKGGTVVIFMMLDALKSAAPEIFDSVTWIVLLNSAEEQMAMDFGPLCLERLDRERTLACLVFEGGYVRDDEALLVVARKGMGVFKVRVEGRASHAGSAHTAGANAIVQMADVVREIASFTDHSRHLTFNVGVIEGGTVVNRVPHSAVAQVEMRAFDSEIFAEGWQKMLDLARFSTVRSIVGDFPCTVEVEIQLERLPWSRNPYSDHLFAVYQEAANSLGLRAVPEERGGLSDGNQLWSEVPTLDGLGPSGANAHCSEHRTDGTKEQEYATRSSFVPKALLNLAAILRLLSARSAEPPRD